MTKQTTICDAVYTATYDWTIAGYDTVYKHFDDHAKGWINNIESEPFVLQASIVDGSISNVWSLRLVETKDSITCEVVLVAKAKEDMAVRVECDIANKYIDWDGFENCFQLQTVNVKKDLVVVGSFHLSHHYKQEMFGNESLTFHFTFHHYMGERIKRIKKGTTFGLSEGGRFMKSAENIYRSLCLRPEFSDVAIETAGGDSIPAHKAVLSSQSSVFKQMFQVEMLESVQNSVKIIDFPAEAVKCALRYLYGQEEGLEEIENCAGDMLAFGEKYDIPMLKNDAEVYLFCQVKVGSVSNILVQADRYRAPNLVQKCIKYIVDNREMVIATNEWVELARDHGALVQRVKDAAFPALI